MQNHKSNLDRNIEKLVNLGILSRENISFYADVFDYQFMAATTWSGSLPRIEIENDGVESPASALSIKLDQASTDLLLSGLADLCAIIHRHNPGMDMTHTVEFIKGNTGSIQNIISSLLEKDTARLEPLAASSKIGADEFLFLAVNWLKPLFIALREEHHHPDEDIHKGGSCPFCGYYPDMALFSGEKEGKRYLRCGLCENLWLYPRIACAICGENSQKKLEYFTEEGDEHYRVDACHTCNGYMKSVKLNKLEETGNCDLSVENLLTISYDSEMLSRGFSKP